MFYQVKRIIDQVLKEKSTSLGYVHRLQEKFADFMAFSTISNSYRR